MANKVKSALEELAQVFGSDWIGQMPVWLGNLSSVVETGTPGKYYARQANGQVITVSNAAKVAPIFDLHVLVRRSRIQPTIWQITEILEDYDVPADGGSISAHHEQHEEEGFDRATLDRKQIKQLSIRAAGGWKVQVYGATVPTATGNKLIDHEQEDLTAYVVTAGAQYIGIETDDEGVLYINDTAPNFGSPLIQDEANIPTQDPGRYLLGYVLMYEGQTEILDEHIVVIMPIGVIGKNAGLQISEADPDIPDDADLFGFWDVVDLTLKAISWANIKETLKTYFDTLYSALGHTHTYLTDAPTDGDLYGRRSGAWEVVAGLHSHSLARWNGASGDTTFEIPDVWETIDALVINGVAEDPLNYSLSSDGTQIVLSTALGSDSPVWANGTLLSI